MASIARISFLFGFFTGISIGFSAGPGNFHDLAVYGVSPSDNPQNGKHDDENAPRSEPPVQISADKKTEKDTPDHRQAELHDNGEVFRPRPVFLVVKKHFGFE
jgi:hypothetical protein